MSLSIAEFKDLVLAVSGSVSMLAVATGIWMSLREYRLKLKAETRQQISAEISSEIQLQTIFSELMKIANGRSGYAYSEKAVEYLLDNIKHNGTINLYKLNQYIEDVAILSYPVGSAAQDAALAAIASLSLRYKQLEQPGLQALRSLCHPFTSENAEAYYRLVKETIEFRKSGKLGPAEIAEFSRRPLPSVGDEVDGGTASNIKMRGLSPDSLSMPAKLQEE